MQTQMQILEIQKIHETPEIDEHHQPFIMTVHDSHIPKILSLFAHFYSGDLIRVSISSGIQFECIADDAHIKYNLARANVITRLHRLTCMIEYHNGIEEKSVAFISDKATALTIAAHFASIHAMEKGQTISIQIDGYMWKQTDSDNISEAAAYFDCVL